MTGKRCNAFLAMPGTSLPIGGNRSALEAERQTLSRSVVRNLAIRMPVVVDTNAWDKLSPFQKMYYEGAFKDRRGAT